mgnify:CR=1 FL=1
MVQRASVLLTIVFNLVAALFLYQLSVIVGWSSDFTGSGFSRFLIFTLAISAGYTFKYIILKFVGFVFQIDKAITVYIFNIFLINNVLGLGLLPVLISLAFLPFINALLVVKIAGIIALSAFIYSIIRGLTIGFGFPRFSSFYLFLYLCALEIAPLLVLIRLIV